jgi:hypothetical protein
VVEVASTQAVRYSSITPAVANTCLPEASLTALALIPAHTHNHAHKYVCAQHTDGGIWSNGGRDICNST